MVVGTETMSAGTISEIPGSAPGHTYSILGTHILKRSNEKLIKIRNPWGTAGFHGTWADDKWDEASKKEVGYNDGKDGIFFIDIATFKKSFTETSISVNAKDGAQAKFMKKNDDS